MLLLAAVSGGGGALGVKFPAAMLCFPVVALGAGAVVGLTIRDSGIVGVLLLELVISFDDCEPELYAPSVDLAL